MKNKILLFFFSLLLAGAVFSQNGRIGQHESIAPWNPLLSSNFSSVSEATSIAQDILDATGVRPNFEIRAANVQNAAAVLYMGKRYILYNPSFINNLTRATGTKWASISVMAHEIGHHLKGHMVNGRRNQLTSELEADEFSGFALRKMGATLSEAQAAMKVIGNTRDTSTHPAVDTRLASISKGWESGGAPMNGRKNDVVRNTPLPKTNPVQAQGRIVLPDRNILADVYFHSDPKSSYYVTTQYNIVKISNSKLYTVGKLAKLNSRVYPYMMYDGNNTRLYVTAGGKIISRTGKNVGIIRDHQS